ncbi:MAG TPA: hypothetical protein VKW04_24065 [Planctomycetota bacterium]|nr:hypothetical protein [Planctomycetota bacterium]
MILGSLAMLVANAAALLASHSLLGRLKTGKASTDLVLFLLLRILLVSATVLAAGLLRVLTPAVLGLAGFVAIAGLVALGEHRRLPECRWPEVGRAWIVLGVLIALRLLLQVWFFAPYLGDSLAYHLPKVAEWVRGGGFTGELGMDPRATFPAGFELLETWWVVFLHHDVLIEMAGVEFFLLGVAGVAAIAEAVGWGARTAAIAGSLFALNPAFHFQATSAVNDGAVTGLLLASIALVAAGSHPLLVLLPVAMGAGVKPTFLYALPGVALIAGLIPRSDGPDPTSRRALGAVAGAALLVGSYWYLRNWAVFGNPIYPMGPGGMKALASGATMQRIGPSLQSLRENVSSFVDVRIYDQNRAPDAMCTAGFGWGPAGFALGALALIPVLRAETLIRRLALGLALSAVSVFTLVELDLWNDRFVVFLAALPALALARLWDRYRFVAMLGWLALVLQFLETMVPGNLPPDAWRTLMSQTWRERSAIPAPAGMPAERVGFSTDDFGLAYPLYRPSYSCGLVYLRETTTDELLARIDREALTVIYVTPFLPRRSALFEEGVRRGRLQPILQGPWRAYVVLPRR